MAIAPFGTVTIRLFAAITGVAGPCAGVTRIGTFVHWNACGPVFARG